MSGKSADRAWSGGPRGALAALCSIMLITAVWWALALWPLAEDSAAWLVRTRAVCFGGTPDGLPDSAGWIALILQPAMMLGILFFGWGAELREALMLMASGRSGRARLALAAGVVLLGLAGVGWRVSGSLGSESALRLDPARPDVASYPSLDRPAPQLGLSDQHGGVISLEQFRGRPLLVTFAYAHCATVCPLVVSDALRAQQRLAGRSPALVVVTLDPWRDTPTRLPHIADRWGLGTAAHLLSGPVEKVNMVLDAWDIPRSRDERTGDISHPALVYVVDPAGRIAYAATGDVELIVALARKL